MSHIESNSADRLKIPIPVTQDRLKDLFNQRSWTWFVDNEGDLGGRWNGYTFYFLLTGTNQEILHILGGWGNPINPDRLPEARAFIADWHRKHLWPKVCLTLNDQGVVNIRVENTVDWESGATDEQLYQQNDCALGTGMQFFEELNEELSL